LQQERYLTEDHIDLPLWLNEGEDGDALACVSAILHVQVLTLIDFTRAFTVIERVGNDAIRTGFEVRTSKDIIHNLSESGQRLDGSIPCTSVATDEGI
jgi:hypothetical protein